jgi:hypothetical protein
MTHDLLLLPLEGVRFPALSVRWDESAGTFTGRDAERVRYMVHEADRMRFVPIHPHPCSHELSADPARSRADLAAILARWYILPSLLAAALPPIGESGDGDAVDY